MTQSGDFPPRVGVGVFVFREGNGRKFIVGKRKGSHGAGTLQLPGGHLEYGESFETCAAREVLEETGLPIERVSFLTATNSVFHDVEKHYVTIFMTAVAVAASGNSGAIEPQLLEPEKCEGWLWTTFTEMKQSSDRSLFLPLADLINQRPDICEEIETGLSL